MGCIFIFLFLEGAQDLTNDEAAIRKSQSCVPSATSEPPGTGAGLRQPDYPSLGEVIGMWPMGTSRESGAFRGTRGGAESTHSAQGVRGETGEQMGERPS